jgi:subtilisin family serine protease
VDRPVPSRKSGTFGARNIKSRRPAGVSRRRKKQLGFEKLEARQVMSAQSPLAYLHHSVAENFQLQVQSSSSATAEGLQEIIQRELYWQGLMTALQSTTPSGTLVQSIPSDPLVGNQWHLINSGQQVGNGTLQPIFGKVGEDINVAPVWNQGIFGNGIIVAVNDSGVQRNHPDLAANIIPGVGFDNQDPFGLGDPVIDLDFPISSHGTSVAGLIGAVADNGLGGTGVSPGVKMIPLRSIESPTLQGITDSFRYALAHGADVINNSWGSNVPRDIAAFLAAPNTDQLAALQDLIREGRDGKGIITVFASGNSAGPQFDIGFGSIGGWDFAGYDGWVNSRYTIGVTGVDHDGFYNNFDGTVMAYPEVSAAVLVAAPTGSNAGNVIVDDQSLGSGLWTTDLTGDFGFNRGPDNQGQETLDPFFPFDRDFLPDTDYSSRFNGTSSSSPIVSGVVALMLEANPELTWRDVQEILVRSARQNAPLEIPQNGLGQGLGLGSQNLWVVNQTPVFHDPDPFLPGVPTDPLLQTLNPILDPNAFGSLNAVIGGIVGDHHAPTPITLTNGAGYTVSQGIGFYGEMIGYGHGVIDAGMAVTLAQQWHDKEQALPGELTFTTFVNTPAGTLIPIRNAQQGVLAGGRQVVPGGIGNIDGTFIDFWDEYFVTDRVPFSQPEPPTNDRGGPITFSVPPSNTMSIESVDIKLSISGGTADLLDHMRILLVSPDGTHSELNNFWVEPLPAPGVLQNDGPAIVVGEPGSLDNGGQFVWTFNTRRSWGERSDNAIVFDATTGEPVVDPFGILTLNGAPGEALTQGWQLVIENYDFQTTYDFDGVEIAWHGSPIAADSRRVQGFVGIDQNHDKEFNYSRVIQTIGDVDNDPTTLRYGEVVNEIDLEQESFAGNVTVTVRRTADNSLVDQFVTGADGNFYFDLLPDDYTISIEDPLGRDAIDDSTTAAQFLRHYQSEWQITADWFNVWDHDPIATSEVLIDPISGAPAPWLNGNGQAQEYGMKGINFLLDPGPAAAPQAQFQGTVVADTNGDGQFNPDDVALPGVTVFGDVNRNGVRDAGEVSAVTNAQGQYTLVVPVTSPTVVNVGVVRPTGWTSTNDGPGTADIATDGLESFFVQPGATVANANFSIDPPANNVGGGGATQPGYLMGVVIADVDGDGVRDAAETGAGGFRVYLDNNNSGTFDAGDTETTTNQFGAWAFGNVAPGQRVVRLDTFSPFVQTSLGGGSAGRILTLVGSSTISNILFGVRNTAILDFGDLPLAYPTASHRVGAYWLGSRVDAELVTSSSPIADGDDITGIPDDEDGIEFLTPLTAGGTATIRATANRNTGYLQAWADWNNDGDFNDVGERIITNRLLRDVASQNEISFAVPAGAGANVFIRFRYGEFATGANAISTPTGQALTGEVEDYLRTVPAAPAVIAGVPSDFDQDEDVDGFDFLAWQRNLGRTGGATQAQGNANGDAAVTSGDLHMWKQDFGTVVAAEGAASAALTAGGTGVGGGDFGATIGHSSDGVTTVGMPAGEQNSTGASVVLLAMPNRPAGTASSGLNGSTTLLADAASEWLRLDDGASAEESFRGRPQLRSTYERAVADAPLEPLGDYQLLRRDRAFEDLLGTRRRQGLMEAADGAEASVEDCDELFAALADHGQWPLD